MKPEQIAKRMARKRWSDIHGYTDGSDELMHHGVKGMKWGVRRYQNSDGTLTEAGKKRVNKEKLKMDAKDLDYYKKNIHGFDLKVVRSKNIANEQIKARDKAWSDYFKASNGGIINNEKTKALRKIYDQADVDLINVLLSDIRVPSGRTPKWMLDETGERKLVFE